MVSSADSFVELETSLEEYVEIGRESVEIQTLETRYVEVSEEILETDKTDQQFPKKQPVVFTTTLKLIIQICPRRSCQKQIQKKNENNRERTHMSKELSLNQPRLKFGRYK